MRQQFSWQYKKISTMAKEWLKKEGKTTNIVVFTHEKWNQKLGKNVDLLR